MDTNPERVVTGHGGNPPGQGPFIRLTIHVREGVVVEAEYETYQCPGCQACGKAITEIVRGKTLQEADGVRHSDVVERVGPLPRHRQVCYGLAVLALADALGQLAKV